jgi:hypothetical protein
MIRYSFWKYSACQQNTSGAYENLWCFSKWLDSILLSEHRINNNGETPSACNTDASSRWTFNYKTIPGFK